jgi:hypothetical protein
MTVETDLETLRQNREGDDVVIYRFRPSRDVSANGAGAAS